MKKFILGLLFLQVFLLVEVSAQNRFEGYNIVVDAPTELKSQLCAVRYVDQNFDVKITDLNPATPMNIKPCAGKASRPVQSGNTAKVRVAEADNYSWCFEGEDDMYRVTYPGDQFTGEIVYNWRSNKTKESGRYNVRDFGAVGDGKTDDTIAVKSALAFIATQSGGILFFPPGDYLVGNVPNYRPLTIPSATTIEGISGINSGASTNYLVNKNPTRITLAGKNRALFRIGECTEKVVVHDIELYSQSNEGTYGIEPVGAYITSQDMYFERVNFNNFYRGIYAHGLQVNNRIWQFDYVKINHCRFIYNKDAGIYTDIINSSWKVEGSFFIAPKFQAGQAADAFHLERIGIMYISDTYGGGFPTAPGGTFINVLDSSTLTVIASQTEAMTNSFVYNAEKNPSAGDYSYPITFVNNIFGQPITFNARRTFVSTGNLYGANTFTADERLQVYSTGDRFCYDSYNFACLNQPLKGIGFDRATVVFRTGQVEDRQVRGVPNYFGLDTQFGAPVQLPSFPQNALPNRQNGTMVYCTNCRRNSTPCQAGGGGAPAMVVGNQWSCL